MSTFEAAVEYMAKIEDLMAASKVDPVLQETLMAIGNLTAPGGGSTGDPEKDTIAMKILTKTLGSEKVFYRLRNNVCYEDSITYQVTENVSQAARLAAVCYAIDTIEVALEVAGIKGRKVDVSNLIAKLIYVTWISLRARVYKRSFFEKFVETTAPKKRLKGKEGVVDLLSKVSTAHILQSYLFHFRIK